MKNKFNYKKYDYSFLKKKENYYPWGVNAKITVNYDLVEAKPMDAPTGQLFYFDIPPTVWNTVGRVDSVNSSVTFTTTANDNITTSTYYYTPTIITSYSSL